MTGFYPIHVAVAVGSDHEMLDFLLGEGGEADEEPLAGARLGLQLRTMHGTSPGFIAGLMPLQLSAHLGHHGTFEHLLRRHVQLLWRCGPVSDHRPSRYDTVTTPSRYRHFTVTIPLRYRHETVQVPLRYRHDTGGARSRSIASTVT